MRVSGCLSSHMWLIVVGLVVVALGPLPCVAEWKFEGIGHVHCAKEYVRPPSWSTDRFGNVVKRDKSPSSAVIVGSSKGTLARIDVQSGALDWRMPSASSCESVSGIAIDGSTVLATVERHCIEADDGRPTLFLRAYKAFSGRLLWEREICGRATLLPGCGVQALACDEGGLPVTFESKTGSVASADESACDSSSAQQEQLPLSDSCNVSEMKVGGKGWLRVGVTGYLSYRPDGKAEDTWGRHEGLAHAVDADFYRRGPDGARVLVVLSSLGGVYGLDVEAEGKVLWSFDAAGRLPVSGDGGRISEPPRVKLLKGHGSAAVVVSSPRDMSRTDVFVIKATDGSELSYDSLTGFGATHAAFRESNLLCVDLLGSGFTEKSVGSACAMATMTPSTDQSPSWAVADVGGSSVRGVGRGSVLWETGLPANGQILSFTTKQVFEPLGKPSQNAAVRVTGKRKVLHKYVDASVALILSRDRAASDEANDGAPGIGATLIDTNTGAVIDVMRHPNGTEPVASVAADNWFVYTFWNADILELEVHVIDMYDDSPRPPWVKNALIRFVKKQISDLLPSGLTVEHKNRASSSNDNAPQCSEVDDTCEAPSSEGITAKASTALKMPAIVRSSFLSTHVITTLGVTVSERGGTDRSIIMGLASGRVAQVSRLFFDARRPTVASVGSRNEMLLPYSPKISLWPSVSGQLYFKEGDETAGMVPAGGIISSPVEKQESSCHVAVLGTDISYGTLAPAGSFDTLPLFFEYGPVVGTLVVLVIALVLTRESVQKRDLEQEWI